MLTDGNVDEVAGVYVSGFRLLGVNGDRNPAELECNYFFNNSLEKGGEDLDAGLIHHKCERSDRGTLGALFRFIFAANHLHRTASLSSSWTVTTC